MGYVNNMKETLKLMESWDSEFRKPDPTKALPYRDEDGYTFHRDGSYNTPSKAVACSSCGGTGKDAIATKKYGGNSGYIACRSCMGNGLDSASLFSWNIKPPKQ